MKMYVYILTAAALLVSCGRKDLPYDASGTFEAVETIISSEATGAIRALDITEGQELRAGQVVGYVDSNQLYLKKKQLQAQTTAILSKTPDAAKEIAALQEELRHAKNEQERLSNLVNAEAATPKQLDDATAQVAIIRKRLEAQQSALGITATGLREDTAPLLVQIEQVNDQLAKCILTNPLDGTVLTKYAEANEMTTTAKPLYKIADLRELILRAYITGNQFAGLKLNQQVTVLTDDGQGGYREYPGAVEWISSKAEFTPKTIQTKDERANLVYATKIRVKNDGFLKLGMYGEVKFK